MIKIPFLQQISLTSTSHYLSRGYNLQFHQSQAFRSQQLHAHPLVDLIQQPKPSFHSSDP